VIDKPLRAAFTFKDQLGQTQLPLRIFVEEIDLPRATHPAQVDVKGGVHGDDLRDSAPSLREKTPQDLQVGAPLLLGVAPFPVNMALPRKAAIGVAEELLYGISVPDPFFEGTEDGLFARLFKKRRGPQRSLFFA